MASYEDLIAGNADKFISPALNECMITMDYEVTTLDANGKPLQILYNNGQLVNFTYRPDGQIDHYDTLGYTTTFTYNASGYMIKKTTTKI